jgi:hypothetical protein
MEEIAPENLELTDEFEDDINRSNYSMSNR